MRDGVGVGALMNAPAGLTASASAAGAVAFLADAGSHAVRAVALAVSAKLTRASLLAALYICLLGCGITDACFLILALSGGDCRGRV